MVKDRPSESALADWAVAPKWLPLPCSGSPSTCTPLSLVVTLPCAGVRRKELPAPCDTKEPLAMDSLLKLAALAPDPPPCVRIARRRFLHAYSRVGLGGWHENTVRGGQALDTTSCLLEPLDLTEHAHAMLCSQLPHKPTLTW